MTNTKLLKQKIDDSGLKYGFIAQKMGLSRQGLQKKIENVNSFKANEIQQLCELLSIYDYLDKEAIFFANVVD